jgi:hypothetical protein
LIRPLFGGKLRVTVASKDILPAGVEARKVLTVCNFAANSILALLAGFTVAHAQTDALFSVDFEEMDVGLQPTGFSTALIGKGSPANWVIEADDATTGVSKVLTQRSNEETNYRFPVCIYEDFVGKNVALTVRFKPISGQIDQAAGLVWRYQDANNYYVVRANALEDNVVLYKMKDGKRSDLRPTGSWPFAYGKSAPVPREQWSTLRVIVMGAKFAVYLNDEYLFDVKDQTFPEGGRVGLWTKADSVTSFDDFTITALEQDR